MDIALIKLIKTPCIQEYRWYGDDGGIPARIQEDCIYIDLGDTEIMDDYSEELKVGFPEV